MRILITGGAGFIGSHLTEHFQQSAEVRIIDDFSTGYTANIERFNATVFEGSILNRELLRSALKGVDYVFHLAAMVSVPESMGKPLECVKTNTLGTLTVLEEAAAAGVKKLCFSSSAAIYGDNPEVPKRETMRPEPKSPYAITKLDGEYYCAMFNREGRLPTACLRYFNVFGPRQDPNSQYAAAVPIFISRALQKRPLTIYGDGEQTRDFIYVKDIVAANVYLATEPDHCGVYNVAYGGRVTINDLAHQIIQLTGSASPIDYAPERSGDVKHSTAAVEALRQSGFTPKSSFSEGMAQTIDFFKKKLRG